MGKKKTIVENRINPFTPDSPVQPELFAGRRTEIQQIEKALFSTHLRRPQHIMVQGERWIGKSSVALYTEVMATNANRVFQNDDVTFLPCCCRLGSCRNLDEMCVVILDSFKRAHNSVRNKILDLLSQVRGLQVGLFGVQLAERRPANLLVPTFPSILESLLDQTKSEYSAILIILDETEHISGLPGAASLLKTLLEQLQGDGYSNTMFMVCATPQANDAFTNDHASFPRLFRYVDLSTFDDDESKELLENTLAKGEPKLRITNDIIAIMHDYSDGFPGVLQELGYSAFEANTDDKIDRDDFISGVIGSVKENRKGALETLYDKHFRKILTQDILSDRYRKILRVIADSKRQAVTYRELKDQIEPGEGWQIAPYLGNLTKRGIIKHVPGRRGSYQITSTMLRLWIRLKELEK